MFANGNCDWIGLDAVSADDHQVAAPWRRHVTAAMCTVPLPSYPFSYQDENFVVAALFCAIEEGNLTGLEELFSMSSINPNQSNKVKSSRDAAPPPPPFPLKQSERWRGGDLSVLFVYFSLSRRRSTKAPYYLLLHGAVGNPYHLSGSFEVCVFTKTFCAPDIVELLPGPEKFTIKGIYCSFFDFELLVRTLCLLVFNPHENKLQLPAGNEDFQPHFRLNYTAAAGNSHGCTSLHLALRRHHVSVALLLLHNGCQTDVVDNHGETAIHVAARDGLLSLAQTLCAFGCKVDVPNKAGLYPLHLAAKNGHTEVVRCLCLAGCNVDQKNKDGIPAEITALAQGHSHIGDLLNRLRNEQLKDEYIAQMIPGTQPLSRIKLKVFGHSGVGKTTLLESLKCGYFSSWFRRSKTSPTSPKPKSTSGAHSSRSSTPGMDEFTIDTDSENNIRTADLNDSSDMNELKKATTPPATVLISKCLSNGDSLPLLFETVNANYTRGIDVQQVTISGVGDLSIWEFSGHEPYLMLYDHFVGNAHCLHLVVFSLTDPLDVQIRQVCFWLAYLQARAPPVEPLGKLIIFWRLCNTPAYTCFNKLMRRHHVVQRMGGKSSSPLRVALVATHADANGGNKNQNADVQQLQNNAEAEAKLVLTAARSRFEHVFELHDSVFVMDAHVVGSQSMKFLKQYLSNHRAKIVQGLPKGTGFLDSMVGHLPNWRKSSPSFPVLSWRQFMDMVHIQVNPLAGEEHMRELIHQLQLMGEV
ncbi:unnamed protein product, partial [Ixodes pacificus]